MSRINSAAARSSLLPVFIIGFIGVTISASQADGSPDDRIHEKLKDAKLRDMKGKEVKLLDFHKGKVLVVAYTGAGLSHQ